MKPECPMTEPGELVSPLQGYIGLLFLSQGSALG